MKKEGRVVVVSSRERKRAGEDAHTHTLKETQRLVLRRECNLLTAVKGFKVDLEASRT